MKKSGEPGTTPAMHIQNLRPLIARSLGWSKYVSPIGILVLVLYYLSIGFTPDITVAQGAIVAAQAGITGALLTWGVACIFSAPGWIYILAINPHSLPIKSRRKTLKALVRRSMLAQASTFAVFLAWAYWPTHKGYEHSLIGPFFALLSIPAIVALIESPLAITSEGIEHRGVFCATLLGGVVAAAFSLLIVWLFQSNATQSLSNEPRFIAALFILVCLSPIHLVFSVSEGIAHLITAAIILFEVVIILGVQTAPTSMIAREVGVAEPEPVMLAMPAALCRMVTSSAKNIGSSCGTSNDGPGLVGPAQVLNSLGSRWLVRDLKSNVTFNIPGKDIVIARTIPPSPTGNHERGSY